MELGEYTGFFFFFGSMILVGILLIVVSHLAQIRLKGEKSTWSTPYECGLVTEGRRPDRFPIHYYVVGILFVIFDVETVFIIPWAVVSREFRDANLAVFWFVEMLVFLLILVVGYLYLLSRGVFNWGNRSDERTINPTD